jgi:D-alanyl-D-alanine carboxypeptidase
MFYVPWPLVKAWIKPLPHTVQEQVNAAINMGFDGIIVYVDQNGKKPEFYAAGYKNRENKIPADPYALFKIASVGKLYDALAVTKLVSSGKLSLHKSLSDYLPELIGRIENSDKITLRMMVKHRSGIPNFTDSHNYWVSPKDNDDEKLALVLDLPADFEPDKDYHYSNTNYLLLGMIMDKVLGYNHFRFIKDEILIPLNLNQTFASIHDVDPDDVMSGYYVGYDADLKTDDVGSMLATAEDLGKFIRALNNGSAFKDQEEEALYASIYEYQHTGLIPGYQTIAKYHQKIDAVVIQFTNTVNFDGYNWNLSQIVYKRIAKILRREESSQQ